MDSLVDKDKDKELEILEEQKRRILAQLEAFGGRANSPIRDDGGDEIVSNGAHYCCEKDPSVNSFRSSFLPEPVLSPIKPLEVTESLQNVVKQPRLELNVAPNKKKRPKAKTSVSKAVLCAKQSSSANVLSDQIENGRDQINEGTPLNSSISANEEAAPDFVRRQVRELANSSPKFVTTRASDDRDKYVCSVYINDTLCASAESSTHSDAERKAAKTVLKVNGSTTLNDSISTLDDDSDGFLEESGSTSVDSCHAQTNAHAGDACSANADFERNGEKEVWSSEEDSTDDVDRLLEEPLANGRPRSPTYRDKVVLKHQNTEYFEVLPAGWMEFSHASGLPVYLHQATRVCTLSRPYFLGPGSVRKHSVPLASIPCLHQKRVREAALEQVTRPLEPAPSCHNGATANDGANLKTSSPLKRLGIPQATVQTVEDFRRRNLNVLQLRQYCEKAFEFKTVKIARFARWSENRKFKRQRERRLAEVAAAAAEDPATSGLGRPSLGSSTRLITVPGLERRGAQQKQFFLNPRGKTSIAVLHEYVQKVLKGQVEYELSETRNAAQPYAIRVKLMAGQKCRDQMSQIVAKLPWNADAPANSEEWVSVGNAEQED